jgi:hypothetical protein
MIMTQEELILKAQDQFEQVKAFIRQACTEGQRIDAVESDLWGRMLEVGRLMLQGYVAGYHQGDLGPTLEHQGRVLRRLDQPHARGYVSLFGGFDIHRYVYGTRETQKHQMIPLDAIFSWFAEQIRARNGDLSKPMVAVCDGERALWSQVAELMKTMGVTIVCILDLFHVMERLWLAAYCFHSEGSAQAKAFVAERLERLLQGEVGYVIGGLKQMGTKHKLSAAKQRQLDRVITYLENNRSHMRHDEYLSQGYPIGSGVIEGACRHVVKDRMEGTGMRWRIRGAQAVLSLRAVHINGDWQAFQNYRIRTQIRQLYPHRPFICRLYRKAG